MSKSKKIDLEKAISIHIEGELGKYNTLPIENLIKIAESLQNLINDIVKYDLPVDDAIDPNNFKIELSGFRQGSAIPQFAFTQRINPTISDVTSQRKNVNSKLIDLLEITDSGNFKELKKLYPDGARRNAFVESIYNLTNSFGNSPTSFGTVDEKGKFHSSYKNIRFKSDIKSNLMVKVGKEAQAKESEMAIGKIKITKQGNKVVRQKIEQVYDRKKTSVSYSPDVIKVGSKQYILNYPLRCSLEQEDDYFVIQYELLDLIGTGLTEDEAENSFNEEFDFLYSKLSKMPDKKLSKHLQRVKHVFLEIVKSVKVD